MGSRDRKFHCCRCKKWHPWSDLSKTEEFGARRRRCVHCDKRMRERKLHHLDCRSVTAEQAAEILAKFRKRLDR